MASYVRFERNAATSFEIQAQRIKDVLDLYEWIYVDIDRKRLKGSQYTHQIVSQSAVLLDKSYNLLLHFS
ncbi:hypothetical protein B4N84_04095, partial [Flavobacterium sp. IR1]